MRALGNGLGIFDLAERPDVNRRQVLRRLIKSGWFKGIEPDRELSVPLPIPSDDPDTIPAVQWIGTRQADELTGSGGNDVLHGEDGDDVIHGLAGADQIKGGRGDDVLIGGAGDDDLRGGKGSDLFHFGEGRDLVHDFKPAKGDQIVIPAGVDVSTKSINIGVLITDGNGQEMVIKGLDEQTFLASDPFA